MKEELELVTCSSGILWVSISMPEIFEWSSLSKTFLTLSELIIIIKKKGVGNWYSLFNVKNFYDWTCLQSFIDSFFWLQLTCFVQRNEQLLLVSDLALDKSTVLLLYNCLSLKCVYLHFRSAFCVNRHWYVTQLNLPELVISSETHKTKL